MAAANEVETPSVFNNDLLLDMILEYAVQDKGTVITCDAQHYRIVNKSWLRLINRVCRKYEHPLFLFHLRDKFLLPGGSHVLDGEDNNLVQFMESNLHFDDHVPPFAIKTSGNGAQQDTFFECLTNCGSGLIQLDLKISGKLPPFPQSNKFFFPNLSIFAVNLCREKNEEREMNGMQDKVDFVQTIFSASSKLKSFTLRGHFYYDDVPNSFGSLLLPSSITNLDLSCLLNDSKLQMIINSSLPNLKSLKMFVITSPVKNGLVGNILKKFAKTLENLYVQLDDPTNLQLPLMEKLENLYLRSNDSSFSLQGPHPSLQQLVPRLKKLSFCCQTPSKLQKWVGNSRFPSVTFLKLSNVHYHKSERLESYEEVTMNLRAMQALCMAFPNVKELNISQGAITNDMTVLLFVMNEMRNLRCLRICVVSFREFENSDVWDAVLIGTPQESVAALRESPDKWEGLQVGTVSICNLTELQTLELNATCKPGSFSGIGDMTFVCAFLKMPKLTNLILKGSFWTTREMARKWEKDGRSITSHFNEK